MKLNLYNLSKAWFDYTIQNSDKIKPSHTALYFWIMEVYNRLHFPETFQLPLDHAGAAIGLQYRATKYAFDDLVEFGFIEVIQLSKNQYTANVIRLNVVKSGDICYVDKQQSNQQSKDHRFVDNHQSNSQSNGQSNSQSTCSIIKKQVSLQRTTDNIQQTTNFEKLKKSEEDDPVDVSKKEKSSAKKEKSGWQDLNQKIIDSGMMAEWKKRRSSYVNQQFDSDKRMKIAVYIYEYLSKQSESVDEDRIIFYFGKLIDNPPAWVKTAFDLKFMVDRINQFFDAQTQTKNGKQRKKGNEISEGHHRWSEFNG